MTGTERADLFTALAELAKCYPHWRVGQLVANVAGWADGELWDIEDEQLLAAAREHLGTLSERNGATPAPDPALRT